MSPENVEVVRRAYEAFNRGDLDAAAAYAAPDFEYVTTGMTAGLGGVYHGAEDYRRDFLERWWAEFESPHIEVHEFIEAGDQVLVSMTQRGRGKQSGAEVSRSFWQVWTLREGRIVRGQGFTTREEALEAMGRQQHADSSTDD